jgi:hypothetical protein
MANSPGRCRWPISSPWRRKRWKRSGCCERCPPIQWNVMRET